MEDGLISFEPDLLWETTQAAHILPFSFTWAEDGVNEIGRGLTLSRIRHSTAPSLITRDSFWNFSRFGGMELSELSGIGINRLENIMTLSYTLRQFFGKLQIWLTCVEVRAALDLVSL